MRAIGSSCVDPYSAMAGAAAALYGPLHGGANAASNAIGYATHFSHSHDAVIRVYDADGNVIETHEHKGEFKEWPAQRNKKPPHIET